MHTRNPNRLLSFCMKQNQLNFIVYQMNGIYIVSCPRVWLVWVIIYFYCSSLKHVPKETKLFSCYRLLILANLIIFVWPFLLWQHFIKLIQWCEVHVLGFSAIFIVTISWIVVYKTRTKYNITFSSLYITFGLEDIHVNVFGFILINNLQTPVWTSSLAHMTLKGQILHCIVWFQL